MFTKRIFIVLFFLLSMGFICEDEKGDAGNDFDDSPVGACVFGKPSVVFGCADSFTVAECKNVSFSASWYEEETCVERSFSTECSEYPVSVVPESIDECDFFEEYDFCYIADIGCN